MASRISILLVFVIPIIGSITIAGAVMGQILQDPGYGSGESSEYISIVGIEPTYAAPASIKAYVHVTHSSFDCGDLYVEVRRHGTQVPIIQDGFFTQCFARTNTMIPTGDGFTAEISSPGTYEIVATIQDAQKRNSASIIEEFTVN